MTPADIHARDVGGIVRAIVLPTITSGGEFVDVLVILESVVAGVLLYGVRDGGDDMVLDVLVDHVRERLQTLRAEEPGENRPEPGQIN